MDALAVRASSTAYHQCATCMTSIPADRQQCYFCSRPAVPSTRWGQPVGRAPRLEHVRNHLRAQDRPFLDYLLRPMTLDEIAAELGPGWTRRQVDNAWHAIRSAMGFEGAISRQGLERILMVRVVAGIEPCWCGR